MRKDKVTPPVRDSRVPILRVRANGPDPIYIMLRGVDHACCTHTRTHILSFSDAIYTFCSESLPTKVTSFVRARFTRSPLMCARDNALVDAETFSGASRGVVY